MKNILELKNVLDFGSGFAKTNSAEIFKAAVPFMPDDKRRHMFCLSRILEIMEYKEDMYAFENKAEDKRTRRERFLKSISHMMTAEERDNLDMIIKMIEIKKIMG